MEEDPEFNYKQESSPSSFICNLLFSHFGLFMIVSLYTCLGAMAFVELEKPNEDRNYEAKMEVAGKINQTMNYVSQLLWFYQGEPNMTQANFSSLVKGHLVDLEGQIINAVNNNNYDGTIDGWDPSWTFAKALLLTMTIISTIGYGHIAPATFYGQMFCIVYALFGLPLLLMFLANIGDAMANSLVYIYSRCCCRWCRSRRNYSELPEGASKRDLKLLIDDKVGEEDYMPTKSVVVPITINLVLLTGFTVLGAFLFVGLEDWSFTSACYFTFITISTIGYGDYYPKTAMVNDVSEDFLKTLKMFTVILYILFGMALLSMALNLMQDQLVEKCRWLAREIGLSKDPALEEQEQKEKEAAALRPPVGSARKESVALASVPENSSPSSAPTRPASALSVQPPGAMD